MKRLLSGIALAGVVAAGSPASAVDLTNQSLVIKKQIASCMTRRMLADRALSYNEAKKTCTEQLKAQLASTASNRQALRGDLTAASAPGLAR